MTPQNDPLEPVRRLAQRLSDDTAKIGLTLHSFVVVPSIDRSEPDHVQCVFTIDADQLGKTDEQRVIDKQFEEMMRDQKRSEEELKLEEARAQMLRRLQQGKVLGGSDSDV